MGDVRGRLFTSQCLARSPELILSPPFRREAAKGCASFTMANNRRDDDLAYGEYHGQGGGEGDRGFVGDMGRRLFGGRKEVRTVACSTVPVFCHCVPCVSRVSSLSQ